MKNKKNIFLFIIFSLFIIIIYFMLFNKEGNLLELNLNQLKDMINNNETFPLCISSTTCSHCQNFKPKLKEVAKENNINIYFIDYDKYNVDEFKDLISFDGSTPTTIFIKNGEEETTSNRINGDVSKSKIIDKLKSNGFIK